MENIITKQNSGQRAKTLAVILDMIIYLYILLFFYTAFSKLITFKPFVKTLSELPYIGNVHLPLACSIIGSELLLGLMLIIPKSRIRGLWGSLALMICFTGYLAYNILKQTHLPCTCGGVISGMTWPRHLVFNSAFILLAVLGLRIEMKLKRKDKTIH